MMAHITPYFIVTLDFSPLKVNKIRNYTYSYPPIFHLFHFICSM